MIAIEMSGYLVLTRVTRDLIPNLQVSCFSPRDVLLGDDGTVRYE
jgi:hypothetical protein